MSRYRFIEAQRKRYQVRLLCQVVAVPASGYYAWQQVQQQVRNEKPPVWEDILVKVFSRHKRHYGTRRLLVALRRKGYRVAHQRLRGALRRRGLHALQPKTCMPCTTDSTHGWRAQPTA
jgi:putative transposase